MLCFPILKFLSNPEIPVFIYGEITWETQTRKMINKVMMLITAK